MNSNQLVAYFSATGTTKAAAKKLVAVSGADLFEIIPSQLYTAEDLDWRNKNSRSSIEMNDPSSRPAIAKKLDNISDYSTIFLGFPIWWYTAPTIIKTFLEEYDFSDKTIVLFATSGSSGLGKSGKDLEPSCSAKIISGKMLTHSSDSEIRSWLSEIKL